MERIRKAFQQLEGRAALIPFVVAADPDFDTSLSLIRSILASGADMIEIGLPYSDPLADGPVIQAAALRSLQGGFSLPDGLRLIALVRAETEKPLIAFTYVNPILQYGVDRFFQELSAAGGDGVIVPDLPQEEAAEVRRTALLHGIDLIPLVAPTSGRSRIERICKDASGFVYCVSSLGVTGERGSVQANVRDLVDMVKEYTTLPVCVGFGVSQPAHAREISSYADGVIVGSAYVRRIEQSAHAGLEDMKAAVAEFTAELKNACS